MKGQVRSKKNLNRKNNNRVLEKYMLSVDEFIQSKGVSGEVDSDRGFILIKKKSRKELRREKRKMKKAKIKLNFEGKTNLSLPADASHPQTQRKKPKEKTEKSNKDVSKPYQTISTSNTEKTPEHSVAQTTSKKGKKTSKLQESRKIALLEANEAEDREIKKLERCLGYNKRKNKKNLPQSFVDDGLDYILGLLDPGSSAAALYDSDNDMDTAKDNFEKLGKSDSEVSGEEDEQGDDSVNDTDEGNSADEESVIDDDDEMAEDENEVIEEDESAQEQSEDSSNDHQEEISGLIVNTIESKSFSSMGVKYVPPHLRGTGDDKRKAELEKLKRTVKGLMNRLSEPNMSSISGQLEELYMSSSRKDMNDTLTEVLVASCVTPALMPDRLLMEHVLLVSVLHHTVGLEVGAHFLETVVRKFDETYRSAGEGKECVNLVAIVAHLYNFHVVHALLIFDILKLLVAGFTERDLELALFVLKNVGFSLRKDDPLALKELISDAQRKASQADSKLNEQSRVHFMLETMLALKNNDMRKIPGYDPEPVEKLRKFQRTLIHHRAGGSDVKLRVSLENLLVAEQVGRWWIVGSSWSGAPMISGQESTTSKSSAPQGKFSAKVLELARKQRMNTEVRRNIFCVLMTSEDYLDAFEKLLRMGLKDQQEREIVHVLMDCCLQEKTFNAFYAVLGDKFCAHDRRFQMTFQFSLWDKFTELSNLPACAFSNLAQLVTFLFQKKSLSISILKAIEFGELDKPKVRFLRHVLTKLLQETEPQDLATIFGRISGIPKLGMLREGLKLFISHFLLKNSQPQGTAEQAAVLSERAQVATKAMEAKEGTLKL